MNPLHYLERTMPTLAENLALDEALLQELQAAPSHAEGPGLLRIWEWTSYAVVLGAAGQLRADIHVDACERDGVEIHRRSSGGGTVLLGPGCLMYSLVLRYDTAVELREVHSSYRWIMAKLAHAVEPWLPGVAPAGICDLAVGGRKVSGNAQQRKRNTCLHHGTLLYDFDLDLIPRYLKLPTDRPEYRGGRDHLDFVRNVPATRSQLVAALRAEWNAVEERREIPLDRVGAVLRERFELPDWVARR